MLTYAGMYVCQTPSLALQQCTYEATRGPMWTDQMLGTQFTCFTGTKVQILTQKALLARRARNNLVEAVLLRVFCIYVCVCILCVCYVCVYMCKY
jgi:hypothetical protein